MFWRETAPVNSGGSVATGVASDIATAVTTSSPPSSFSRPPTYPTPSPAWGKRPSEKENVHDPVVRHFSADEMRSVPALGRRLVRKDPAIPGNSQNISNALEELEGILMYVESVTASLSHRARAPIPPERVRMVPHTVVTLRPVNADPSDATPQCSLAVVLQNSVNAFLSWLAKLEYLSLSQDLPLEDIEKNMNAAATDVEAALDAVEQRYQNHDFTDVQEFFMGSRQTLEECRRVMQNLLQVAQRILALRRCILHRDVVRAKEVFGEYEKSRCKDSTTRIHSPFFAWVEKKWFPAMEAWNRIVESAHKQATLGNFSAALARGQQEALSQSSVISEILHPKETLSDLMRKDLEEPLARIANTLKTKQNTLAALRAALAAPHTKKLTECVCAVEKLAADGKLTAVSDQELLKEGKRAIIRHQQVENIEAALRLAIQVDDTLTLFRTIHQANEIILQLGIAGDVAANKKIVSHCAALLAEMEETKCTSPSEFIARRVDPMYINVVHVPSKIWSAETAAAYQAACQRLTTRAAQDLVRFQLERVMESSGAAAFNRTLSSMGDDTSNSSSSNRMARLAQSHGKFPALGAAQVQELRAALDRAREVGLKGQVIQDTEACLLSVDALKLKVHFEAQLRVVRIQEPEKVTFEDVYQKVFEVCMQQAEILPRPAGHKLRLRYQDADGDCISLVTQEDWNVFVSEQAPHGMCGAKLDLYCDFPPVPHARVADTAPSPPCPPSPPTVGEKVSPMKDTMRAGPSVGVSKTPLRTSLLPPHRKDADRAGAGAQTHAKLTRTRSAGFALTHKPTLFSRHMTAGRAFLDDMLLQNPYRRPFVDDDRLGDAAKAVAAPEGAQNAEKHEGVRRRENRNCTSAQGRRGRSRVPSVRLGYASPKVCRMPPSLVAGEKTTKPKKALLSAASPAAVSPPLGTAVSGPSATTDAAVELVTTKKWKDDDTPLELQTVASVVSTMPSAVKNKNKMNNNNNNTNGTTITNNNNKNNKNKSSSSNNNNMTGNTDANAKSTTTTVSSTKPPTERRHGGGFTVTKCAKNIAVPSRSSNHAVLEEKREWSADMFMLSDIRTVVSDHTTPPSSVTNRQKTKQGAAASRGELAQASAGATEAVTTSTGNIPKTEVLQQLRLLREENQKALRVALHQRRKGT